MDKRCVAKVLIKVAKNLIAITEAEHQKELQLIEWKEAEYNKLEKTFGDIRVWGKLYTLSPLKIDVGRDQFDFEDFQGLFERKKKELEDMKNALQYAKSIRSKVQRIAEKEI